MGTLDTLGPYASERRMPHSHFSLGAAPKVTEVERRLFRDEMDRNGVVNCQFHDHYNSDHGFALAPGVLSTKVLLLLLRLQAPFVV